METCHRCGAALDAAVTRCGYCGAATQRAHELSLQAQAQRQHFAYQQQQFALHHEVVRQQEALASIKRTALHSVIWSALGMFCCLVPIFGVVGIVMSLRARKMARNYHLVIPITATLGLIMGAVSLVASLGMYTFIIVQQVERAHRIEALEKKLHVPQAAERLTSEAACNLAELRVLKDGVADKSGSNIEDFECNGQLEQTGDRATLHDYSFREGSQGRLHVKVCYGRGTRWSVTGFRRHAECNEPDDTDTLFLPAASGDRPPAASVGGPRQAP